MFHGLLLRNLLLVFVFPFLITIIHESNTGNFFNYNRIRFDTITQRKDTFFYQKDALPYLVQLPPDYSPGKKLLLVVYLHSGSNRLKSLDILENFGLPGSYNLRKKDNFITLSPLLTKPSDTWVIKAAAVLELIKLVKKQYEVDNKRVYITGHSLGSNGSLYVASKSSKLFAGIVVLGAGYSEESLVPVIITPPIWLIHAENDENVPASIAKKTAGVLRKINKGFMYSIMPNYNHSQLLELYNQDSIYNWLLKHRLK